MTGEVYISEENLLGFIKGIKLGHDNSEMQNTFLSYFKGNWYGHEYRPRQQEENNNEQEEALNNNINKCLGELCDVKREKTT